MKEDKDKSKLIKKLMIPWYSVGLPLFFILFGEFIFNPQTRLVLIYSSFIITGFTFLIITFYFKKAYIVFYNWISTLFRIQIVEGKVAIYWGISFFFVSLAIGLPRLLIMFNLISKTISDYLTIALIGGTTVLWVLILFQQKAINKFKVYSK